MRWICWSGSTSSVSNRNDYDNSIKILTAGADALNLEFPIVPNPEDVPIPPALCYDSIRRNDPTICSAAQSTKFRQIN